MQRINELTIKAYRYAVYTKPHHERKAYNLLDQEKTDGNLPMQTTLKQWNDRKKKVNEPLFRCYLFIIITQKEYYKVLNIPGVVRFITYGGKTVTLPGQQSQLIKNLSEQDIETIELSETIPAGARVEIKTGLLTSVTGELIEYAGKKLVIIRIGEICKLIMVNVRLNFLTLAD